RGYGGPQGFFALESQMDACAAALGLDPVEFRRRNVIRAGEGSPIFRALGEGKEGFDQTIQSYGLDTCIEKGMASIGWREKRGKPGSGKKRRGVGCAFAMHGTGIPGVDMGAAAIKMNEDASFNLMVGATDIGTGSDTVFAQIAAEVLDVAAEKIQVYSSDTDFTPFDVGAYASSTTYISGQAVKKASEAVKAQIVKVAARLLEVPADRLRCRGGKVFDPAGRSVTYEEIALHSLYVDAQFQIMGIASHMSYDSPPPFATQFAEVEVDCETGEIKVEKLVACVDCGVAMNPKMAEGQIEGGLMQSLGYALSEAFHFDEQGNLLETSFRDYALFTALDMPPIETHLIETYEPTGPFGAKSVAEIPMDGTAPAIANALFDATGVRITEIPITPERMRAALQGVGKNGKS
ncbi:MAG: xanthine dehydrogenase, partial [Deltaproteobacteria bacterium]